MNATPSLGAATGPAALVQSTIGKKVVMAVSGLVMVGFVTIHMAGNLLVFAGQEHFNHYAEFIQSGFGVEPGLLWLFRAFMLAMIGAHIWAARALTLANRAARPVGYAVAQRTRQTTYAARFMLLGGLVLLGFLFFHLAHLTVGAWSNDPLLMNTTFAKDNAYNNLVTGLSNPVVVAFYILANLALGAHLHHGISSGIQTLGLNTPTWNEWKHRLALGLPAVVVGGNIVIALAILAGVPETPVVH